MKTNRYLLILLITMCCFLASCGKTDNTPVTPEEPEAEEEAEAPEEEAAPEEEEEEGPSVAELSEQAMENFLAKLEGGDYVFDAKDYCTGSVCGRDQVTFDFVDDMYDDLAVMSIDNETFQGILTGDTVEEITYLGEGQAIDAASERLPNLWLSDEISDGNIYNLFFNDQEDPLKFVSYEDILKQTVGMFAGYGQMAGSSMHEVYMTLDNADPTVVHIQAEMDSNPVTRVEYEDIDLTITFGGVESNAAAEAWMSDPVYPEGRTEWTDGDIFVFNSVFLPGYGKEAVPFPAFASYALKVDDENFLDTDLVVIRDARASEEDMEAYIADLKAAGFEEVEEENENGEFETYYRKLLRDEYKCYSSIVLNYNDGVDIVAKKHYDFPIYSGADEINEVIVPLGFMPLADTDEFFFLRAKDTANELTESWLYFFDYDLVLYVDVSYSDYDALIEYLDAYGEALSANGFKPVYTDESEEEIDRYENATGLASFRYHEEEDGRIQLLYKAEKYITPLEAAAAIKDAGFPEFGVIPNAICRDLTKYEKAQYDLDLDLFMTVSETFENMEQAEAYLSEYEARLTEAGYGRVDPSTVGCKKSIAIYNEDTGRLVGIDVFEDEGLVCFDFKAE